MKFALLLVLMMVPMAIAEEPAESETYPEESYAEEPATQQNQTAEPEEAEAVLAEEEPQESEEDRPCRLYRYEGLRPQVGLYPLLGMVTLDPDRCWLHGTPHGGL